MIDLGYKGDRHLVYADVQSDWKTEIPTANWLLVPIGNRQDEQMLAGIADNCLNDGLKYICAIGKEAEFIHDFFDNVILTKRIKNGLPVESPNDFENEPMTSWHDDLDEGIWFAVYNAFDEYFDIERILILDMTTKGELKRIKKALEKIN